MYKLTPAQLDEVIRIKGMLSSKLDELYLDVKDGSAIFDKRCNGLIVCRDYISVSHIVFTPEGNISSAPSDIFLNSIVYSCEDMTELAALRKSLKRTKAGAMNVSAPEYVAYSKKFSEIVAKVNAMSTDDFLSKLCFRYGFHYQLFQYKATISSSFRQNFMSFKFSDAELSAISTVFPGVTQDQIFDTAPLMSCLQLPLTEPCNKKYSRYVDVDAKSMKPLLDNSVMHQTNPFCQE